MNKAMKKPQHKFQHKQPKWSAPMLATLTYDFFSDPNWIFERKLDGMRCLLHKQNNNITIWSRNKAKQNLVFPEIVNALSHYPNDFILDCEIVTFAGQRTSFEKLQQRMHVQNPDAQLIANVPVVAYVFDILYLNGYDVCGLPLLERKKILRKFFKFKKPLQHLAFFKEHGLDYYKYACANAWEGIIAKRANATYEHHRSQNWLKFKCDAEQELVIGGFTKPRGQRVKFGALLMGYYDDHGNFIYAGKVGTGFDTQTLEMLHKKMYNLKISKSPFKDYTLKSSNVTWIKPKLVAQLGYTEWTNDGKLRHPRYLGLRTDKAASAVRREG